MPIVLALKRLKDQNFRAILSCIVSWRSVRITEDLVPQHSEVGDWIDGFRALASFQRPPSSVLSNHVRWCTTSAPVDPRPLASVDIHTHRKSIFQETEAGRSL